MTGRLPFPSPPAPEHSGEGPMGRRFPNALAASAIALALAACAGSPEPPTPTADELARSAYERIVSGSNALLMGDHLGWFGTDDAVVRVGVSLNPAVDGGLELPNPL